MALVDVVVSDKRVLFSSTHHDPTSVEQQNELLELRRSGKQPRYSWDYDPEFEIYEREEDGSYKRLTDAKGYDAEASYSPDGKQIVFASNRAAYDPEAFGVLAEQAKSALNG